MATQAERFGQAGLTRAADIISTGLDQMRGATSPRLLLELMCAQVLLPAAATDEKSLLARLERLESAGRGRSAPVPQAPPRPPYSGQDDDAERSRPVSPVARPASEPARSPASAPPAPKQPAPQERTAGTPGPSAADLLRKNWDAVLEAVRQERRVAWMLLRNASVLSLADGILTLRFPRDGDLKGFSVSGHDAVLKRVLSADFGLNVTVKGVAGGDAPAGAPAGRPGGSGPSNPASSPSRQPAAAPPEFAPPDPAGYDDAPPDDVPPDEMPPDEPSPADRAVPTTELTGMDLIQRELGGQVIGEIDG
jgi:DNA polymerase-3 subunit gamma/tau